MSTEEGMVSSPGIRVNRYYANNKPWPISEPSNMVGGRTRRRRKFRHSKKTRAKPKKKRKTLRKTKRKTISKVKRGGGMLTNAYRDILYHGSELVNAYGGYPSQLGPSPTSQNLTPFGDIQLTLIPDVNRIYSKSGQFVYNNT